MKWRNWPKRWIEISPLTRIAPESHALQHSRKSAINTGPPTRTHAAGEVETWGALVCQPSLDGHAQGNDGRLQ